MCFYSGDSVLYSVFEHKVLLDVFGSFEIEDRYITRNSSGIRNNDSGLKEFYFSNVVTKLNRHFEIAQRKSISAWCLACVYDDTDFPSVCWASTASRALEHHTTFRIHCDEGFWYPAHSACVCACGVVVNGVDSTCKGVHDVVISMIIMLQGNFIMIICLTSIVHVSRLNPKM